jgi:RHS repeat-associated protein
MADQSGVAPEAISLPRGGGAVRGIGETFAPDLHTGTGSYRIPLWFPRGPGGFQPEMGLVYSSGAGNGPFGMGWRLPIMTISRRTDRGLPVYDDTDTLLLDGEELAPLGGGRYRHRREEQFRRIQRVGDGWVVHDRSGRRFQLGTTPAARVEHTSDGATRVLAWCIEQAQDRYGNTITYQYRRDGDRLYLERVVYGPWTVTLTYEQRDDPITDRRPGFDLVTGQRCSGVAYRLRADPEPSRSYTLTYEECPHTRISLLASVTCSGHRTGPDGPETAALPTVRLTYTPFQAARRYLQVRAAKVPPPPFTDRNTSLVDLEAGGLPGVVRLTGTEQRFWPNAGTGQWGRPRTLRRMPAAITLADPAVAFADLDGNGTTDLLVLDGAPLDYIVNEPGEGWTRRARFRQRPTFSPRDREVRLVDADGDGLADALRTGDKLLYLFPNGGDQGWSRPRARAREHDLARFPDLSFSDPRVKLADLTGDGLFDIAWVHGGRIDYWPHYGNGRFGARATLALEPAIGRGFDPRRLFLSDVNGDGVDDVVYLDDRVVRVWVNRGGRMLVLAAVVRHTPPLAEGNATLADLLGTGTAGVVWSYPPTGPADGNYKYLDLTGGVRPYLLASIDDGTGLVTEVTYRPSTEHAQAAAASGAPWRTALPFPVQVVTAIVQRDATSKTVTSRRIRYHDGLFDGRRREFRGFGRAEVLEEGDADVPPARTISWFHQGVRGITPGATDEERTALVGKLYRLEVNSPDGGALADKPFRVEDNEYAVRQLEAAADGGPVLFPHLTRAVVTVTQRGADAQTDTTELAWDDHGNPIRKQQRWDADGQISELVTTMAWTGDTSRWILALPVELRRADAAGTLLALRRFYYDGDPFVGLPLGQVERGNLSRREDLVLTDDLVTAVWGAQPPDLAGLGYHRMPLGGGAEGWAVDGLRQRHDARGNSDRHMDPLGRAGQVEHDADGIFAQRIVNPLGHAIEVAYDPHAGEIARLADGNGAVTTYRYDPVGRLVVIVKPGDSAELPTTQVEYADANLPLGVRTRLRPVSGQAATLDEVEYVDGFGRTLQRRTTAEGGQVLVDGSRRYNARGWEADHTTPFLSTVGLGYVADEGAGLATRTSFRYDALGRIVETLTPDGRPSRIRYDPGRVTRWDVSDTDDSPDNIARGHFDTPRTDVLDAHSTLLAVIERQTGGSELVTRYAYDPMGRLQAITDPRGVQVATYTHDLLGRKIQVQHVDAGRRQAAFDARGNLVLQVDAEGRRTEVAWDELGRQRQTLIEGAITETFHYDTGVGDNLLGRLARVDDQAGATEYSYTPRGLIAAKTRHTDASTGQVTLSATYTYDALERMHATTVAGATTSYHYNERGLLASIDGFLTDVDYNAFGQVTQATYANGVLESFTHNPTTFYLDEQRINGPTRAEPYYHLRYGYDAVGNPLTITDEVTAPGHTVLQRTCSFDALARLTAVEGNLDGTAFSQHYAYDDAGNFRRNEELGPDEFYVQPAASNRIRGVRAGGVETPLFDYDDNGNLVATPEQTLTFDPRGRLIRATKPDGTVVEHAYDHTGVRVRTRVAQGGATHETLYLDRLVEVRDGQPTRFVVNGDARLAAVGPGGQTRFFHHDHLGSVVLVTGPAGEILLELGYHPFGTVAFTTGPGASPDHFLGNELDSATGLIHCRARWYDPHLGRFVSPDLYALLNPERLLATPSALHPYAYAADNPLRLADPAGTFWGWLLGALLIAALVVATIVVGVFTGGAGFAFGILLAASIGSGLGAGVGTYAAWRGGGSLESGFLFGALVGGAAGAGGYLVGAALGGVAAGSALGSTLAGAAQGAVIGAGNGAIVGYAGGAGSIGDILRSAALGAVIGAALGGLAGYLRYSPPNLGQSAAEKFGQMPVERIDPATGRPLLGPTGQPLTQDVPIPGQAGAFWQQIGQGPLVQSGASFAQRALTAMAQPLIFASVGAVTQAAVYHDWDAIKAWLLETFGGDRQEITVSGEGES